MGSMRIDEADESGSMFLVSSITVDEDDCDEYVTVIQEVLNDVEQDWIHDPIAELACIESLVNIVDLRNG